RAHATNDQLSRTEGRWGVPALRLGAASRRGKRFGSSARHDSRHNMQLWCLLQVRLEHLTYGGELKILQELPQSLLAHIEIGVVAEAGQPACLPETRLLRIDFPRMEIENERHLLGTIDRSERPFCEPIGQEAEITAARHWHDSPQHLRGGQRELYDRSAARRPQQSGVTRCSRNTVAIVGDGEDTRVVAKSQLAENVDRPKGRFRDRIARRPVTEHRRTDDVLKNVLGAGSFFSEHLRRLPVHQLVAQAVARNLMTSRSNRSHQAWRP